MGLSNLSAALSPCHFAICGVYISVDFLACSWCLLVALSFLQFVDVDFDGASDALIGNNYRHFSQQFCFLYSLSMSVCCLAYPFGLLFRNWAEGKTPGILALQFHLWLMFRKAESEEVEAAALNLNLLSLDLCSLFREYLVFCFSVRLSMFGGGLDWRYCLVVWHFWPMALP